MKEVIGAVTNWAEEEISDAFGMSIDCEGSLIRDGGDYYVDGVSIYGNDVVVHGQASLFGDIARRVELAILIENAETIADLPEGLVTADEDLRELAKEKFEELEEEDE